MTETEYSTSQSEIVNDFLTKNLILKEEEYRLINGFIDPNKLMKLKLLYSTAVSDYNAHSFHYFCNGKGPTLTVIKATNGKRFGGYASVSWLSLNRYVNDDNAFLFSLDSKKCFKKKDKPSSLYDHYNYGPTFGEGHDLYISNECKIKKDNYCSCPNTYNGVNAKDLAGENNFIVENYEVYSVKLI